MNRISMKINTNWHC